MKTLCISVRLKELVSISPKAFKACDFNGNTDIIPKSTVFGDDCEVEKSEAYWIASWILEKKNISYSSKKTAWFDENGKQLPTYTVVHHTPETKAPVMSNEIDELKK